MGNKNAIPPRGSGGGVTGKDDAALVSSATGGVAADEAQSPSLELLASLQALGESDDYTLLPQSLHQIAETYSLRQDHQWAVQFLRLEKLYHERLLSNLTTLQEKWESEFNEEEDGESRVPLEEDSVSRKHIEKLSHICRTHHRPSFSPDQKNLNAAFIDTQIGTETLQSHHGKANKPENTQSMISQSDFSSLQREEEEERQDEGEEALEEGQEVEAEEQEVEAEENAAHGEDTPEEEEVKVEWPAGVAQASDKDLAKLSIAEGSSSPDGLVSILKRRRASLDGLPPPSPATTADKQTSKRKVRFSEPEDGVDQDDVGGDSCLILLLLCLVTVVISIGGTAFYCTLVDTYSNICTDFAQNVDFYVTNARGFLEGLGQWLPLQT
ncbi:consortin-like isoform X1 [Xiphophorus maculatus]|uniref:Consortin, connexin sorting protein b n=1 Tax=Xiphophorus maculatus TaxID=8083 RepID=A0A3B5PZG7_XIPMA|nr:consortin-like isoform X1 [Xiphophorus maculatus]XP_023202969.1 consortin-like isoform X1 [Xiphophorus maculatus]XP_023202970.1 consortin-like isoform X1 [Xiphophorus maculatus]